MNFLIYFTNIIILKKPMSQEINDTITTIHLIPLTKATSVLSPEPSDLSENTLGSKNPAVLGFFFSAIYKMWPSDDDHSKLPNWP